MIDMSTIQTVHLIGIGGVSVSAIAEILHTNGYEISGSDMSSSPITEALQNKGLKIYIGHSADHIKNIDLVVYTSAVTEENPELSEAIAKGIPCLSRAEMLGQIMCAYQDSIAISGTHGKTTTTSMITRLLNDSTFDPTALVGGFFSDIESNVRIGKSELFITEACEYKESFLSFFPKIGIILNIDEDHLDYYRDLEHIISAFAKFADNIHEDGVLVLNGDDYNSKKIKAYYQGRLTTFGINSDCDFSAKNIVYNHLGFPTFDVYYKDQKKTQISLSIPGQHNVYNALAAIAAVSEFIKDYDLIQSRLNSFKNAKRRFEQIGSVNDISIIDEYAHHPSEIKATLQAARRIESLNKLYCIFQPHTYSRTKELLHEFAGSFKSADEVILTNIYAAREVDKGEIHSKDLLKALLAEGINALFFETFDEVVAYLAANCHPHDFVMTIGAGDVNKIGYALNDILKK
ncbi:UDP-N-acetylmuramate--L-alanine ligase [Fusibacter ferrireducens]|uniref:UDP-N-acetylmuramate--L-alanine ligase n=1 Tax=Fusibacter ferrireducens TaxID=2785058 RepID=A0ABS0A0G4_9FIRM|nr:UDP-N-acetylmuramate--L-alanine ligase [Fusibacter ferrireducens]MBF4695640.1 UDP-N-acetylmuramate--L-alanine ligase [Fusibacter ferrireducens]